MAKRKNKFNNIIIHPNRWLIWAFAFVLVVTIVLVGFIKISDTNLETQSASDYYPISPHR